MDTKVKCCLALLVLLFCCVSEAEVQKDSISHSSNALSHSRFNTDSGSGRQGNEQTERPTVEPEMDDRSFAPDIWIEFLVLRDRVFLMQMDVKYLETSVTELEKHREELQKQNDAQNVELWVLQVKLKDLETKLTASDKEMENLKQELTASKVAFSATLLESGEGNIGSESGIILKYRNVITNSGQHYNPYTGYFTAPLRGIYFFRFSSHFTTNHGMKSTLYKNDDPILMTGDRPSDPEDGEDTGSNGVVLQLDVGDVVSIQILGYVWDDNYHRTSFSGFLLFPM